jgi:hypothetical protein
MLKIIGGIDFETVTVFLPRCRKFRQWIEMRVLFESQTFLIVPETAEVPQNLFKAWIVTEHLWYRDQILELHQ